MGPNSCRKGRRRGPQLDAGEAIFAVLMMDCSITLTLTLTLSITLFLGLLTGQRRRNVGRCPLHGGMMG